MKLLNESDLVISINSIYNVKTNSNLKRSQSKTFNAILALITCLDLNFAITQLNRSLQKSESLSVYVYRNGVCLVTIKRAHCIFIDS